MPRRLLDTCLFNMSGPPQEGIALAALPQDILRIILRHSHDLDSLLSTISSCRAFYAAFKSSTRSITRAIVCQEISVDILPEAIQTLRAATFSRPSESEFTLVKSQLFGDRREALLDYQWNPADGIAAIRLNSIIESFASDLASCYLSLLRKCRGLGQNGPPSMPELLRIKRALYRFEIFCRLFPPDATRITDPAPTKSHISFLALFSPWEEDQLASIHESLWRRVAPSKL